MERNTFLVESIRTETVSAIPLYTTTQYTIRSSRTLTPVLLIGGMDVAASDAESYNEDMSLRISALSDIVFKYIFGTEKSTEVLKSFINAVQKDRGFPEIDTLEICNPINEKTLLDDKISIIDIKAKDLKGDWYIVEVQIRNQPFFQERSLYYWARTYADQLPEGREYMHHALFGDSQDQRKTGY
jgi:hypothetical protein